MIAAPPKPSIRRAIQALRGRGAVLVDQLNVLGTQPQGAPQIDSQTYPDECDPTHPFHFDFYLASNLIVVQYAKLSFFLRAFRSPVASVNTATSGASSASSSGSSSASTTASDDGTTHAHEFIGSTQVATLTADFNGPGTTLRHSDGIARNPFTNFVNWTHTHGMPHTHGIPHTHDVTPTLDYGIFEGAVATGVTVKVNGTDRTAALGGGTGFTTDQSELALLVAWLNLGAWNTIDLTPSGLGRITGHLTVVSYIQSV